uniref:Uncharacterized protein n=1 Tax=Balaenoptera musculus TaxID=9771 RepID=A0A8C0D6I7_BALMU
MRVGDDHRVFHVFGCGDGHLLGRLPTKESAKRQRVARVERPKPRGAGPSEEGGARELVRVPGEGGAVLSTAQGAPLGKAATHSRPGHWWSKGSTFKF